MQLNRHRIGSRLVLAALAIVLSVNARAEVSEVTLAK